jgi:endonuclease/exonuclease/phosphatase family metal-dependent hydrolase
LVGVGREDGKRAGEYSPVLFRSDIWSLLHWETIWLSETPDVPSKGWDAASIRIMTVARLQHTVSKVSILVASTHMDDQGSQSRLKGAKLIKKFFSDYTHSLTPLKAPSLIILAGDFNSEPTEEAYKVLESVDSPVRDLRNLVPSESLYGHENTFTGFGFDKEPPKMIDFIFIGPRSDFQTKRDPISKPESSWYVDGYGVLESRFENGVYNSDHRAVVGDISLR